MDACSGSLPMIWLPSAITNLSAITKDVSPIGLRKGAGSRLLCVSLVDDFTIGGFKEIIDDTTSKPEKVNKVVLCTGKIYYELLAEKEKQNADSIAIIRIDQIYPFPKEQTKEILAQYKNANTYLWVQEEPANMGAWEFIQNTLLPDINIKVISRPASGSPATGSNKFHIIRQQKIIDKVFEQCDCPYINDECKMACIGNKWKSFEKELLKLNVDNIKSTYHSGLRKLE